MYTIVHGYVCIYVRMSVESTVEFEGVHPRLKARCFGFCWFRLVMITTTAWGIGKMASTRLVMLLMMLRTKTLAPSPVLLLSVSSQLLMSFGPVRVRHGQVNLSTHCKIYARRSRISATEVGIVSAFLWLSYMSLQLTRYERNPCPSGLSVPGRLLKPLLETGALARGRV